MNRLITFVVLDSTPDIKNDIPQRNTDRDFGQAGPFDLAGQREHFGSLAVAGAHAGKPVRPPADDMGDIGISLNIINVGGLVPQT